MKVNKKLVCLMLVAVLMFTLCATAFAEEYQTLYAPGKSKSFPVSKVEAQLKVGWYTYPVTKIYAEDGRTKVIKSSDVEAYKKVGWFDEPFQRLYTEDGRNKLFLESKVEAQLKVGWYTEPVQRLYAEDGRNKLFPESKVEAQLTVGWYIEPVQRLYALGRSKVFPKSQVEEQLKVGWYTYPVSLIYTKDKRTKIIKTSDVEAYKKVGWFVASIIKIYYPDGATKDIPDIEKADYEAEGWYTCSVEVVYAPDGREKVIKLSDVEAYEKVGWSRYPFFQIKCDKDNGEHGVKKIYWEYVPKVKNHTVTIIEKRNNSGANDIAANKSVIIKNVTSNYVNVTTYPNCSYTIKVTGGGSKGEATFYVGGVQDDETISKINKNSPKTKTEADKLMVSVTVPVWKLSSGKKVSSTTTITVHKDIAEPIKKVFNEIYNGKEKFPIKDIIAYAWRGGTTEHNSGTAIDINSNENYCIYGDGTVVGSHWLPDKDPYSIKPYGDVVHAFEKNGFTWGGDAWSKTIDYMHFSYCGT